MSKFLFSNPGYCPCCRSETTFGAYQEWLRDFYICQSCGSVPRQRHIAAVLDERFPGWERLSIHESSPSADYIARWTKKYCASQYFEDVPRGQYRNGVRSEDIQSLTLADESIDLFISQDVLEHVFDPEAAIRDIHRVIKPGGAHVFTAPKHRGLDATVQRARLSLTGEVEHLLSEEYHGNPIGERALVTFDYGYDFERLMSQWAGASVEAVHTVDRRRGLDGEFNEVFIIGKPGVPRALARARSQLARRAPWVATQLRRLR